ncbi:MAG TPA: LytTR family DNA-binding domain-containing protein [Chitinophagaceae bacterium]|jgi:DNA-binding LytR/AlgR family response regulator|nr:LytTR family DNA-binding domain-containing protein [Chitinophagaceae bacterium]HMU59078.1 LytTR family DNA-binding domain-containing protein [Chitinophagaceae bacterium]
MYKTLVVDDNKVARVMLVEMLKKLPEIELVGEFEDAPSALAFLKKNKVDVLFLDVEMPEMSGIDLLKVLPDRPLTILVTAQAGYAVEAFELNVVDYLVKPLSISRVILAVERVAELMQVQNSRLNTIENDHIFIRDGKTIRKIFIENILWLEAKGDYVKIVTQNGNYVIHTTLRNLEEKMSANDFVRIHRGYIIPVRKIDFIEDGTAFIQGTPLPVSENYKNDLLKRLRLL